MKRRAVLAVSFAAVVGLGTLHGAIAGAEETDYGSVSTAATVSAGGHEIDVTLEQSVTKNEYYDPYTPFDASVTVDGEEVIYSHGGSWVGLTNCDWEVERGEVGTAYCETVRPALP